MSFAKSRLGRFLLLLPLITFLSISFGVASLVQASGPASVSVKMTQPETRANDNQVLVTLSAEQATEIYGVEFIMDFNPDELQVIEVLGGNCAQNTMINLVENTTGAVRYATMELARRTTRSPETCTIAQVMFEVNTDIERSTVMLNDMILVGPNAQIEAEAPSTINVSTNISPTAITLSNLVANSTSLSNWLAVLGLITVLGSLMAWRMKYNNA